MKTFMTIFWNLIPGNPVFQKVVYGGSVRAQHAWLRMCYLGAMILVIFFGLTTEGLLADGQMGLGELAKGGANIFGIIAYLQLLMVCLVAPIFMAGAIREEHASETLEILLTTPLSNLQIIWGSLLGRLFLVLALLFSGLPLFAILQIFGGVPMSAVLSAFFVAALTAVMVGSVGVVLAVTGQDGRKGVFVFVIMTMGFFILTFAADRVARQVGWHQAGMMSQEESQVNQSDNWQGTTVFTPLNPILVFESQAYRLRYGPSSSGIFSIWMSNPMGVFSWAGVGLSVFLLTLSTRNLRTAREENKLKQLLIHWLHLPAISEGQSRPAREVWVNPVAWREAATRARGFWQVLSRMSFPVFCTLLCWLMILLDSTGKLPKINNDEHWMFRQGIYILLLLELAVILLVALYMSAGSVSRERDEGTLDLVLSTPITPRRFIWGKLRGVVSFVLVLIAAPMMTLFSCMIYALFTQQEALWQSYFSTFIIYPVVLIPFVASVVAVGMYFSIRSKTMIGAIVPAICLLTLLASIGGFCSMDSIGKGHPAGIFISSLFSPPYYLAILSSPIDTITDFKKDPNEWIVVFGMSSMFSATAFCIVVYTMISQMVRQFDYTVRKLSGRSN